MEIAFRSSGSPMSLSVSDRIAVLRGGIFFKGIMTFLVTPILPAYIAGVLNCQSSYSPLLCKTLQLSEFILGLSALYAYIQIEFSTTLCSSAFSRWKWRKHVCLQIAGGTLSE